MKNLMVAIGYEQLRLFGNILMSIPRTDYKLAYNSDAINAVQDILQEKDDNKEIKPDEKELLEQINRLVTLSKF